MAKLMTDEQAAVVQAVKHSEENIVVDAVAGSGKTSTLVSSIKALPQSSEVTCLAFNKRIAEELQVRMPPNADCRTMNSLGHRVWMKDCIGKVELDTKKGFAILDRLGVEYSESPDLLRLIDMCKAVGYVPDDTGGRAMVPDDLEVLEDLAEIHDLDLGGLEAPLLAAREGLKISIEMALEGRIDFNDQLYMPALWDSTFPTPDYVMIDEAQDISPIQRKMLHHMTEDGGKLIAVGDRHQAIYAFRGADSASIPAIEKEWWCKTLPMTISFRCPHAVVHEAQKYVPHINSHESAPTGTVVYAGEFYSTDLQRGSAILCRNTKPLVDMCFKLIARGIGAVVLGRDIGRNLERLCSKWKRDRTVGDVLNHLEEYRISHGNYLRARHKEAQASLLDEKVECIYIIAGGCENSQPKIVLTRRIQSIFSDKQGQITLSTVHKAKGLEWPHVYFLDTSLIPSRFAKTEPQLQQESNIAYVGVTRAQQVLTYIESQRFMR